MDGVHFGTFRGIDTATGGAMFDKGAAIPRFYTKSVIHPFKSAEAGKPVFEPQDWVEILTPGERDTVDREVQPWDKQRWREQRSAYQEGREQAPEGTPLAVIFPQNPEIVDHLRSARCHTVEQLAELNDHAVQNVGMGALDFRARAQKFLAMSAGGAKFAAHEKRLEDLEFRLKQMADENAALRAAAAKKKTAAE